MSWLLVGITPIKGPQWLKIGYGITPGRILTKILRITTNANNNPHHGEGVPPVLGPAEAPVR